MDDGYRYCQAKAVVMEGDSNNGKSVNTPVDPQLKEVVYSGSSWVAGDQM